MIDVTLTQLEKVAHSIFRDDGQNVFSDLLLPCPYCGETYCHKDGDKDYFGPYVQVGPAFGFEETLIDARVVCSRCHVSTSRSTASSVSIAPTGKDVTRLHAIAMAIDDWNRRA